MSLTEVSRPDLAQPRSAGDPGLGPSATQAASRRRRQPYPVFRLVAAVAVAMLTLIPLLFVIVSTVQIGWEDATALLFRSRVGDLLINTLTLLVAGMLASAVLGTAAAWLVVRTTLPGRRIWGALLAAPLAVPAFVNSYA
ncbi:MAG: binding-protein-dependent transport system inner rane component, partial [Myxococcales bacterium]|nr:binding-protein-dependent transport system inner rane component [Myxococcales bacterium]